LCASGKTINFIIVQKEKLRSFRARRAAVDFDTISKNRVPQCAVQSGRLVFIHAFQGWVTADVLIIG
jgi:hypothetical protein